MTNQAVVVDDTRGNGRAAGHTGASGATVGNAAGTAKGQQGDVTPKRERRAPLTLVAVTETAHTMLVENGLDKLSLRSLASRLGVTAPALYAHLDDKQDLLVKLADDGFALLLERFEPLPTSGPADVIHHLSQEYLSFAREHTELLKTMFLFKPEIPGVLEGERLPHAGEIFGIAFGTINEAIRTGAIESNDVTQTNITIWGAVYGLTTVILAAGESFDRQMGSQLIRDVVNSILRGKAPETAAGASSSEV